MKTNIELTENSEKVISRLGYLADSRGKRVHPLKEDVINLLISIAKSAYDHLDDQDFQQITGLKK